jgi:hypothetical protein
MPLVHYLVRRGFRVTWRSRRNLRSFQVVEDLLNHHGVFNAGDDFHGAAAFATRFNINVEHTL